MIKRIKTGIDGLNEVIEGGFPKGSLILLAGEPGTGKTVFSIQFLTKGCELGEPGVYASFAEAKDTLINNSFRHLGVDLAKFEAEGKLKVLDFTAMREEAVSTILEMILREVEALKAERLVIDSFSAIAQAFKEPIEVRIIVNTVLDRIARGMGCTTVMVEEIPISESKIGLGMEEFVADGVLKLRAGELDGRLLRDLEILKLRGTRLDERKLIFTLEKGFKAFPPFKPKPIEKPRRFQPIPDLPNKYSTGSKDLDKVLDGGFNKGETVLLEIGERISIGEYHLVLVPIMLNFIAQGRGILLIPSPGVDAEKVRAIGLSYGLTDDEINRLLRVCEPRSLGEDKPYSIKFDLENLWEAYSKYVKLEEDLRRVTGQPVICVTSVNTFLSYFDEATCEKILSQDAIRIHKNEALGILVIKPGYEKLTIKLSSIATIHLKLVREHGCLLLYGLKPRTNLYAVEMDVSKGYPLPKLTPIV
ncbi:MAG: ATPase domain-containing protein [Candidatus Bathyarchaeia archaeon]|nr:AAA family ATPase [Candidatus Bathyarchaeota archaeon]